MAEQDYLAAYQGRFTAALRWPQFETLWARIQADPEGWYFYHLGDSAPAQPLDAETFLRLSADLAQLLRREHDEDYCGIVYADDLNAPTMIKVYDPNNLGMVCGSSANAPLPGWVLSRIRPVELSQTQRSFAGRGSWWRRILGDR